MTVDRAPAAPVSVAPPAPGIVGCWLEVDGRRCALATRALVLAAEGQRPPGGPGEEDPSWMAGADLREVGGDRASFVTDPAALADAQHLASWAAADTTVLLGAAGADPGRGELAAALAGRLLAARAAGVAEDRLAVDVAGRFDELDLALALGRPVAVSAMADDPADAVGLAVAAVVRGARIVRTDQVHAVRRAVDVLAAVLEEV